MPRYIFVIHDDGGLLDYTDVDCDDQEAAHSYAKRVISELQHDGYTDEKLIITVEDTSGELLFSHPVVAHHQP